MASDSQELEPQASLTEFHLFPLLPAELRIQIWKESFYPRVLELHRWFQVQPYWSSNSSNPVALSVCSESRALAREHYSVLLPVLGPDDRDRILYLNPDSDIPAILGFHSIMQLREFFRIVWNLDPYSRGLRRVGLGFDCWVHDYGDETLGDELWFNGLEQFILLMYAESKPPANFKNGECMVEDCQGMNIFTRYMASHKLRPKRGKEWMAVARAPMRIVNLIFNARPSL
ncbi:hypothetical protein F5B20DRAFT_369270 [Whalleya microplaca]|nr:hypothetical protein F5B20DRAFT_369270 [Whalleya microplaca]